MTTSTPKDRNCVAASVLCYSKHPHTGETVFLLGRERSYDKLEQRPKSKKHRDKCWSDFGGKREHPHEPAMKIAAREFFEEAGGMVRVSSSQKLPQNAAAIENELRTPRMIKCYDFKVNSKPSFYRTYVLEIPYQKLENFKLFRKAIHQLSLFPNHPAWDIKLKDSFLEKTSLRWISLSKLSFACEQKGHLVVTSEEGVDSTEFLGNYFTCRLQTILSDWPERIKINWRLCPKIESGFANFNRRKKS